MARARLTVALGLLSLVALRVAPAAAQLCGPADNPCVVSGSINVASGSVFDLGARDLVIAANKTVTVLGAGLLTIFAHDILLDDGARIVAPGNTGTGGDIDLEATGAITLDPSSRIDASGGAGGSITLTAASVTINGQLRANATTRDGEGGIVSITTSGNTTVAGTGILGSAGDRFGCGGFLDVIADGAVTVSAPIEFKGGDCDGGDIDIDALGAVTVNAAGTLNTVATYEFGSGGSVSLTAGGDLLLNGAITETGSGSLLEGGGDGGDVDIIANNVTIGAPMILTGAGPDGSGGFLDVTAFGDLVVGAALTLTGAQEGVGGDALFAADGKIDVNQSIDATAGFAGGSLDAFAGGRFQLAASRSVSASGTGSPFGQIGGTIDVVSCDLTIPLGSSLLATGSGPTPRATIHLRSSGVMTIGGSISAGAAVLLRYRTTPPVFLAGFTITPAPSVAQEATLPCCVGCISSTTTTLLVTTTSTSTTTTSSSIGGSTSTVTTSSTSTTSSTVPLPCGAPLAGCRTPSEPFKAKLIVRDKSKDSADKVVWKWLRGEATAAGDFGDPVGSDDYALCVWSVATPTPALLTRVDAPHGGLCSGKPCWRSTGRSVVKGYKYVDDELSPNGAQKIVLTSGVEGKAKVVVKAKGTSLALPALPLALPVRVQLQGGGGCFEAFFQADGATKNTMDAFEGRASVPNTTTSTTTSTTTTTSPVPICGNGAREGTEECDDGNLADGDCCSSSCTAEAAGQACAEDGNVCTFDECDGAGACAHPAGHAGLICRPASGPCDMSEQCDGVAADCPADAALPNGTACDLDACFDGETCTGGVCGGGTPVVCGPCDACDATLGCVATPAESCRQPIVAGKSIFLVKDRTPDDGDKLVWKWARGELTTSAELGTPDVDDAYTLCLYDESGLAPVLATELDAPAGGQCGNSPCWRKTSAGFKYVDVDLAPDGIKKILLKAGADGQAKISLKAKGALIPMPTLPLGQVLRVQLRGNDQCWEATYSPGGFSQNDPTGVKARSD